VKIGLQSILQSLREERLIRHADRKGTRKPEKTRDSPTDRTPIPKQTNAAAKYLTLVFTVAPIPSLLSSPESSNTSPSPGPYPIRDGTSKSIGGTSTIPPGPELDRSSQINPTPAHERAKLVLTYASQVRSEARWSLATEPEFSRVKEGEKIQVFEEDGHGSSSSPCGREFELCDDDVQLEEEAEEEEGEDDLSTCPFLNVDPYSARCFSFPFPLSK